MKTVNQLVDRRVAKVLKPRNPVILALQKNPKKGGAHVKKRGALRRAEKMAIAKEIAALERGR